MESISLMKANLKFTNKIRDNNITSTFRVSILGKNQIFGLQECINHVKRITSWKCISHQSTVYFIPVKDFTMKFLKKIPDEIIKNENAKINQFLSIRNESLFSMEKASDVLKLEQLYLQYSSFSDNKSED